MNLVLYGFKCCGKSTSGVVAADILNRTFVDVDWVIEALYYDPLQGRDERLTCREIFQKHGEAFFRNLEREAVRKARLIKQGVIATGGGALLDFFNYVELKRLGTLVYLKADRESIHDRILQLPELPAYFDPNDVEGSFDRMFEARAQTYEHVADRILDVQGLSISQVAQEICALYWELAHSEVR